MAAALDKLRRDAGRPLFAPIFFRLAMAIEQIEWREMAEDAALASFTLRTARKLFGADVVVNAFDSWLEAGAAGVKLERDSSGAIVESGPFLADAPDASAVVEAAPVRHAIDVCSRLSGELGDDVVSAGYLTGGVTLLHRLYGAKRARALSGGGDEARAWIEPASRIGVALANAYCEAGAGALLVAEDEPVGAADHLGSFDALFNVARYFDVPMIWIARHPLKKGVAKAVLEAGASVVAAPGEFGAGGVSAPLELFSNAAPSTAEWLGKRRLAAGSVFVTEWDLPPITRPEAVLEIRRQILA